MSNQQPPGSNPPGLPTTYPTTTNSYTTQGPGNMMSTSYSPYPSSQPGDPYRSSLGMGSGGTNALPSMRTFDPEAQARPMPLGGSQGMPFGAPQAMPPGPAHPVHLAPTEAFPSYYNPGMMAMNQPYGISPDHMVPRYNMPPDARHIGHRPGPKKEIKRRTKTGCLTCRKRRIKCDETQPTCNNCKKSKRECLGYDPMFRQTTSTSQHSPGSQSTQGSTSTAPPGLSPSSSSGAQTALQIPYGPSSAALSGGYPPTSRQTPPSASSQLSHDPQFGIQQAPPPTALRGHPGYEFYPPPPDHAYRPGPPTSVPDEGYPSSHRSGPEDPY